MDIILANTWRSPNSGIVSYSDLQGDTIENDYVDEDGVTTSYGSSLESVRMDRYIRPRFFTGVPMLESNGDPLTIKVKIKFNGNTQSASFPYNYIYVRWDEGYFITNIVQKAPMVFEVTGKRDVMGIDFRDLRIRLKTETLSDLKPTDPVEKIVNYPISNIPQTNSSVSTLSKDLVDNSVSYGRLYVVLSQNKTDVPNLQKLASQGDIADLLKNMSFSSLNSSNSNFEGTPFDIRYMGSQAGGTKSMTAIVPGGYYFMTGDYSMEKLFRLLRDDPHFANIVQDMWWSPLTFGMSSTTPALEGIGKEPGITLYQGALHQSEFGTFTIKVNMQEWFSKYSIKWAGQEITWSPSDYGDSGTQRYYWRITRAISSSDSDKLVLFLDHNGNDDIQIGVISVPVVKINPITRSFTTSLQSSFYSILTGNTLGLLGYTASNIGKDNDNDDDEDGGDKEKVNPIMQMLADIFAGIAGTLLFSGSVAPLKDAQNAVATGGGAGSNPYTSGGIIPELVKFYPGDLGFKIANSVIHTPNGSPVKAVNKIVEFKDLKYFKSYSGELIGNRRELDAGVNEELNRILNNGIYVYNTSPYV